MFNRFIAYNLEPDNNDDLIFTIELTDKNSIKEKHLLYNQPVVKGNGNSEDKNANESNDTRNFERKNTENERFDKKWSDRNGAKNRKRLQFLMD